MPKHVTPLVPALCAALLAAVTLIASGRIVAHAEANCLSAPNLQAGERGRWVYRTDRSTRRKCWYIGSQGMKGRRTLQPAARRFPIPIPRPPTDIPARATAAATAQTGFLARWLGEREPVIAMHPETEPRRDGKGDNASESNSHNETPPISPVLTDADHSAAQLANHPHLPELFGAVLAFAALLALGPIGCTMFIRYAARRLRRRHWRDRTGKPPTPMVRIAQARTEFARAVRPSQSAEIAPKAARDPADDRLRELEELRRQLEDLGPGAPSDRLHELEEIHRQLEELLRLLQDPQRAAA
jgi:hypothetical protein